MEIESEHFACYDRFISQISKQIAFTCENVLKAECNCTGFDNQNMRIIVAVLLS